MSKKTLTLITVLVIVLGAVIGLRLFTNEDTWLCQNGQWVKHGNPSTAKPTQGCGIALEKSTQEQITEIFSNKYSRPASNFVIGVATDTGSFAKGSYNQPGAGGGLWFAAKTNQGWELAFDGNGIIPCDAANKYELPKDMVPQCIDTQNNNNLVQR